MSSKAVEEKTEALPVVEGGWPLEEQVPIEEGRGKDVRLFLAGPTGCGKTELSMHIAKQIGGEIVSVDSMQIYRGMDIGTAKATFEQQAEIPHHMIDIRDVSDPFSVVDFYYGAQQACEEIQARGRVPIIVGGAGFYLHSLIYGPPAGPPSVGKLRHELEERLREEGADTMFRELEEQDPDYAHTITPHDKHKIVRALEIITLTGDRVSRLPWSSRKPTIPGEYRCFFIHRPRAALYNRVEERCEAMIEEGLIGEVERLDEEGLRENSTTSQSIGYKQCLAYLDSDRSPADYKRFVKEFKKASRRYVKRQFTWFRREPLFEWVDVEDRELELIAEDLIHSCDFLN